MLAVNTNPIGVYSDKSARRWDNTQNRGVIVKYQTGRIPAILIISTGTVTGTLQVFDCADTQITSTYSFTASTGTSIDDTVNTILKYTGTDLTGEVKGYYYLKIVLSDSSVFYTDMFEWVDSFTGMLKYEFSNLKSFDIGGYLCPYSDIDYVFYLDTKYNGITPETEEESEIEQGTNNLKSGSRTVTHTFDMMSNEPIFKFLSAIRIFRGNGTIQCTWQGVTYNTDDVVVEKEEEFADDLVRIKFEFKDKSETISMLNI